MKGQNSISLRKFELQTQISERKLARYSLESALLDTEPEYSEDYRMCIKDEIENHNCFIADYEEELRKMNAQFPKNAIRNDKRFKANKP